MFKEKTLIIINEAANAGRAVRKWELIKAEVLLSLKGEVEVMTYRPPYDLRSYLNEFKDGVHQYIIGGGDGTINLIANILYKLKQQGKLKDFVLGAIALGSSNDFFKPNSPLIQNIPVRINLKKTSLMDIGKVYIKNKRGEIKENIFLVNAGMGVTAKANYLFNNPNSVIVFFKSKATQLAIFITALLTILKHSNRTISISFNKSNYDVEMSNLSITIIPYISGSFHYKKERERIGIFGFYLCKGMGRMGLIKTLLKLSYGSFEEGENQIMDSTKAVNVKSKDDIPLEIDGEIFLGNYFTFHLIPNAINLAT